MSYQEFCKQNGMDLVVGFTQFKPRLFRWYCRERYKKSQGKDNFLDNPKWKRK